MIPISAGLQAHLSQPYQTIAWCLKITLTDSGPTILGFTSHDADIDFDGVTYVATTGFMPFDVVTGADLSVDNSEVEGVLESPSITIDSLRAGYWEGATIEFFALNWQDTSQGALVLRTGWLGNVGIKRGRFQAELRGLTQAYTKLMGQQTSPTCRNNLGDSGCQVDLTTFTFTTTVDSVIDNQVILAAALTQPGPGAPTNIVSVTQANPGVVTLAAALSGVGNYAPITIYGCTGMTQINGTTLYRNPSGATFQLGVNTTSYPAYTGGGKVVPLGGTSGYFDGGICTFNDGLNAGKSMDIRSSVPGQIVLQLPMYSTIAPGDSITVVAGCNKSINTCINKFSNAINFNGEPYLPGVDKIIQVGKQQQ